MAKDFARQNDVYYYNDRGPYSSTNLYLLDKGIDPIKYYDEIDDLYKSYIYKGTKEVDDILGTYGDKKIKTSLTSKYSSTARKEAIRYLNLRAFESPDFIIGAEESHIEKMRTWLNSKKRTK